MSTARTLRLVAQLYERHSIGRDEARKLLGTRVAAADVQLKSLLASGLPIEKAWQRGKVFYRWRRIEPPSTASVGLPTVLAGHFAASLAKLFEETSYGSGMRQAAHTLARLSARPERFHDADRKFVFISRGGEMAFPDREDRLTDAIDILLDGYGASLTYRHQDGRQHTIAIEPLSVAIYDHQLYLIARRPDHTLHPYRFARIETIARLPKKFEYPPRTEYDPEQLFRDSIGVYIDDKFPVEKVRLRVSPQWAQFMRSHRWHRSQQVDRSPDGYILSIRVRRCPELTRWALGFGADAEVLEPAALRAEVADHVARMAALYGKNKRRRRRVSSN
jgi:predicted DNA-binding transcriptional regulator YafY